MCDCCKITITILNISALKIYCIVEFHKAVEVSVFEVYRRLATMKLLIERLSYCRSIVI